MRAPKAKNRKSIAARDQLGVQEAGDSQCEIKEMEVEEQKEWKGKGRKWKGKSGP